MLPEFGFKELYSVFLKATLPMEIDGQQIEPGETIVAFDKIQLANFKEVRNRAAATGAYDNRALVVWDETERVDMTFRQGIFSKKQLALLTNSRLKQNQIERKTLFISKREEIETDEEGYLFLQNPSVGSVFIYEKETMTKLRNIQFDESTFKIDKPFTTVIVDYVYSYSKNVGELIIGQRAFSEYINLEGRTRFKDDITGTVKTGIIQIPRLQVTSNMVINMGDGIAPVVGVFTASGHPVGRKGDKKVMDVFFLEDDIDSDIL